MIFLAYDLYYFKQDGFRLYVFLFYIDLVSPPGIKLLIQVYNGKLI